MKGRRSVSGTVVGLAVVIIILAAISGYFGYVASTKKVTTVTVTKPTTVVTTVTVTVTSLSTTTAVTTTTKTTTTTTTTTATTTTTPAPVTITVADSYSTSENAAFNVTLAQFEQAYPWIHVEVEYGASIGTSTYLSEAKAGDAPIVIRDSADATAALFAAGVILNMTPYLPPGYMKLFNPVAAEEWEYMGYNNTVTGLPDDLTYIVMFYNKKFITAPPNTTDQLVQIAESVNKTYGVWGISYGVGDDWGYRFAAWFYGYGGQIFTTINGKLYPDLNSSAMVNALEFWYNLTYNLKVNYLAPSAGAGGVEGQLFIANKTAIIFDGPWDFGSYYKALGSDLGVWPLPIVNATGLYATPMATSIGWSITTPQASGATPAQIEAAVIFVEYMTNYTAQLRLFEVAHDVVANEQALQGAIQSLSTNTSPVSQDFKYILIQAEHIGIAPSVPQLAYYWPSFHQYATEYFAEKITAQQAAQGMEQYFIQQLESAGLLSPAEPQTTIMAAPEGLGQREL